MGNDTWQYTNMEDSRDILDPKKLTSLSDIKMAYDKLYEEEVRIHSYMWEVRTFSNMWWEESGSDLYVILFGL